MSEMGLILGVWVMIGGLVLAGAAAWLPRHPVWQERLSARQTDLSKAGQDRTDRHLFFVGVLLAIGGAGTVVFELFGR